MIAEYVAICYITYYNFMLYEKKNTFKIIYFYSL